MASGHVNRIKRPNTWLHRPMLQNVKKALANPEPSTHGTHLREREIYGAGTARKSGPARLGALWSSEGDCELAVTKSR